MINRITILADISEGTKRKILRNFGVKKQHYRSTYEKKEKTESLAWFAYFRALHVVMNGCVPSNLKCFHAYMSLCLTIIFSYDDL